MGTRFPSPGMLHIQKGKVFSLVERPFSLNTYSEWTIEITGEMSTFPSDEFYFYNWNIPLAVNPSNTLQKSQFQIPIVPDIVVEMLAKGFDKACGGDWERFAEGLGYNLQARESIRILPGEIDQIEKKYPDTRTRLRAVLNQFCRRCRDFNVSVDPVKEVTTTLRDHNVFGETPYNRLARDIENSRTS